MVFYFRLVIFLCMITMVPHTGYSYSSDVLQQLGLRIKTIVIDAGHGGKDPGTVGNGVIEKEQALIFAKELGKQLQGRGYKVYYTRTTDVYVPLEKRTEFANTKKADLFISIHCNSHTDKRTSGFETYYLSPESSDRQASFVASRENGVAANKLNSLQIILSDITLNTKLAEARDIAQHIQKGVLDQVNKRTPVIKDNRVRSAIFFVLVGARMPSVLIEMGYLSNPKEAGVIVKPSFRKSAVQGVIDGIQRYEKSLVSKK